MVFAFDTLGYSKRLRAAGIPDGHTDAHAEAAREFIMTELAIKSDLIATKSELKSDNSELSSDLAELKEVVALRSDIAAIETSIVTMRTKLLAAIQKSTLQTTIRLGSMVIAGFGVLAASIGVLGFMLRAH